MKYLSIIIFIVLSQGCKNASIGTSYFVTSTDELQEATKNVQPGEEIVMANGEWEDIEIRLSNDGTDGKPIILRAETPGKVIIQGKSDLKLGGDYQIVEGLYFTNGYSPSSAVISFEIDDEKVANHSVVTNCVIKDFNKLQRNKTDLWVLFKGRHNQMDHCYIAGKSNRGPTVRVDLEGNQNIKNYHKIIDNHFGPRPPKGGPSAETIQIGNSYTSMCPSYTTVANNFFERCNGEVEVISSKTNFNEFRNNVFYKSEGSLVTRHGNYCTVDGNYFIGDPNSENIGGIRLIGTGHRATNNYFYNLQGENFRSPLAVMNGIPKSPLNRYIQVTDVVIAYNSWINCKAPLQFGVGSNVSQKDVLPASEIRSARPIRTVVANNLIYNDKADKTPIVAHDLLDGIRFESNVINNQGVDFENSKLMVAQSFDLTKLDQNLWMPTQEIEGIEVYPGFEFDQITEDLFGTSRKGNNSVGAVASRPAEIPNILDKSKYGAKWYGVINSIQENKSHLVNSANNLVDAINKANDGDSILIEAGNYEILSSLKIDKTLSITSTSDDVKLVYNGKANTPLFSMNPKGQLFLSKLKLQGNNSQYAFASLQENMSSLYNLKVTNCTIENFKYIVKGYKYSFAEHLHFSSTRFKNCENGIELSEEIEDKGEYNAENITIKSCHFENIKQNVIDYYRGGYDESTVGGNLSITDSDFFNCGAKEKNGTLLNTYGIINVSIIGNTFQNNKVELVALLWGAKNNTHTDNKIINSGKILVEENLKLNLLY